MFAIDPFPPRTRAAPDAPAPRVGVIIPTRDRAERLGRCLDCLAAARRQTPFEILVCDSSGPEQKPLVREACARAGEVQLIDHDRLGAAAARNVGTAAAATELLVFIDDDVYVEPHAIAALVEAFDREGSGRAVVAGEVRWSHWTSAPMRMRRIGFGRDAEPGEDPEFLVSALLLVPRALAARLPWNERLWPYDDRYATMLWRAAGSRLCFATEARAQHDPEQSDYPVGSHADRIYANLIDSVLLWPKPGRALGFELLSFAACAKSQGPSIQGLWALCRAWVRGHWRFLSDLGALREQARVAREIHAATALTP